MTILKQLKAIRKVAHKNLHKNPEYFQVLIQELDLKILDIENETLGHLRGLEMDYLNVEPFDLREVG